MTTRSSTSGKILGGFPKQVGLFVGGFIVSNLVILALYLNKQEDDFKRRVELYQKMEQMRKGIVK